MLKVIKEKMEDFAFKRCGNCPAFYSQSDYWGETDEGCTIRNDIYEFCPVALLPKVIVKPYVDFKEKQEEKYFMKMYEKDLQEMNNKCSECKYEYNKDYESKCPSCGYRD